MVYVSKIASAVAVACLTGSVVAHPGEHHDHQAIKRQVMERDAFAYTAKRALNTCADTLQARAVTARSVARRAAAARELRQRRNISGPSKKYRRDLATLQIYEAIDHNTTGVYDYSIGTSDTTIFSANTSAILAPENTDGPYYVTGEQIRKDVTEGQRGVPLYLEVQYIDMSTCLPVPEVYVDIWNCNATGVYGGINVTGNVADGGYNSTFLRGIQATDDDGVVAFETIFPGHYSGRATHTHLLSHTNVTVFPNNTISTGAVNHIGQLFWDESLRSAVELTYPYNTNTQDVVSNDDDMWSIVQAGANDTAYDPFPEYMYLDASDITQGLMAWIQIGINVTADQTSSSYYSVAAAITEDGVEVSTSSFGGGSGGPGENGTAPSGSAPAAPSSTSS